MTIDVEEFKKQLDIYGLREFFLPVRSLLAFKENLCKIEPQNAAKIEKAMKKYGKVNVPWLCRNLNCSVSEACRILGLLSIPHNEHYQT